MPIITYVPLRYTKCEEITNEEVEKLDCSFELIPFFILWLEHKDGWWCVFILGENEAENVKNHTFWWSDNDPKEWFFLVSEMSPKVDGYAVSMMMNMKKFVNSLNAENREIVTKDSMLVTKPITFLAKASGDHLPEIGEKVNVGFADLNNSYVQKAINTKLGNDEFDKFIEDGVFSIGKLDHVNTSGYFPSNFWEYREEKVN